MDTRTLVSEMADMLAAGNLIPALDRFYDKNVEVSAVGVDERLLRGKSEGFRGVYNWFLNCLLHRVDVEFIVVDGDKAAIELLIDSTPSGGQRLLERVVLLQTWSDGKITRMTNYSKRVTG